MCYIGPGSGVWGLRAPEIIDIASLCVCVCAVFP